MSTKVEIKVMILQVKEYQRRSANQQQLGERHGTQSPSDPLEGTNTALTLILDFQPPEPCYNRFLVLKPSSVCPVLLPGKSHGQRSLVGCSPWGHEESDMTERLHFHFSLSCTGEGNGNPLQCSCLENPRDDRAWWAAVYGVAQSQT